MRSVFFSALLALGAMATAAASQSIGPQVVQPNLGLIGKMSGSINLPIGGSFGFGSGVLSLGTPQYLMNLELPQGPLFYNPVTGAVSGPVLGTLQAFPLSPIADVFATVGGSWTWHPATGHGYFRADIILAPIPPLPPLPPAPPLGLLAFPIGSMRASFVDFPQVSPTGFDPVGSFQGGWAFLLQTATPPLPDGDPYPGPTPEDA